MLASRLLKASGIREGALHESGATPRKGWSGLTEGIYIRVLHAYEWSLKGVLAHSLLTVLVMVLLAGLTVYLFKVVPKGFIPSGDAGLLLGSTEAAQGVALPDMIKHQNAIADIIQHDPN